MTLQTRCWCTQRGNVKSTQQHEGTDNYFPCTGRLRLMRRRTKGLLFRFWLCAHTGERFPPASLLLLSHPGLLGQRLPPRDPGGAGTHHGHRCLASGTEVIPAQGSAWDPSLPRGEQLLLHPHPQGSTHHACPAKVCSSPPSSAEGSSLQPTGTGKGALLAAPGTRRHCQAPGLAAGAPAVMPDQLPSTAPLPEGDGAQSPCSGAHQPPVRASLGGS